MSTHCWYCAWCGEQTSCCSDSHALGSGQSCCCNFSDKGKKSEFYSKPRAGYVEAPPVEFCSLECFDALAESMKERRRIYLEVVEENR